MAAPSRGTTIPHGNLGYIGHVAARETPDSVAIIDMFGARERVVTHGALEQRLDRVGVEQPARAIHERLDELLLGHATADAEDQPVGDRAVQVDLGADAAGLEALGRLEPVEHAPRDGAPLR